MNSEKHPKVSVLVPVYNVEKYLPRCLDSVLGQTFQDFEIVCVNDASPDGSMAVLRHYAESDSRVVIIDKPQNEGLMMARRTGYKNARGDYFFFLDSDDYLPKDALQALYEQANESGAGITVGNMELVNERGRKVLRPRARRVGVSSKSYLKWMLNWGTPSLCGSLFSRKLFDGYEYTALLRHGFSEDRILLTEILTRRNPRIAAVDVVTYDYWLNNESITRKRPNDKSVTEQFKALYLSYDIVNEAKWGLDDDNKNFIIRYLSLYVEKGCSPALLRSIDSRNADFLRFNEMKRYVGARLAAHTWLCCNIPGYRPLMHGIRLVIRRLQGKD